MSDLQQTRAKIEATQQSRSAFEATVADRSVARASIGTIGDESIAGFMEGMAQSNPFTKDEHTQVMEGMAEAGKNLAIGLPSAFLGTTADLTAMAVALGYNTLRMAQGDDFAWPEDFNNVPATSDFYGTNLGADTRDFAFIGGALAVTNPARYSKFVNKTLKMAKALKGGRKASIRRLEQARSMDASGTDIEDVWKETGWWKNPDGKWRFYISDADSQIQASELGKAARNINRVSWKDADGIPVVAGTWPENEVRNVWLRADEILKHDALFEMYPELAGRKIFVPMRKVGDDEYKLANRKEIAGYLNTDTKNIHFQGTQNIRESVLHELQHSIQLAEDFEGGASLNYMLEEAAQFREALMFDDIAKNPESFLEWTPDQLYNLIKWANPTLKQPGNEQQLRSVMRTVVHGIENGFDADDIIAIQGRLSQSSANTSRYLNEASLRNHGQELEDWIKTANPADILSLSIMRYNNSLGEAEARLIESLVNVRQADLDKLPANPQRIFGVLKEQIINNSDLKNIQGVRPARGPVDVEDTFLTPSWADVFDPEDYVDLSKNKLPPLEPHKVKPNFKPRTAALPAGTGRMANRNRGGVDGGALDVPGQNDVPSKLPGGTDRVVSEDELKLLANETDPEEVRKILESAGPNPPPPTAEQQKLDGLRSALAKVKEDPLLDAIYGRDLEKRIDALIRN